MVLDKNVFYYNLNQFKISISEYFRKKINFPIKELRKQHSYLVICYFYCAIYLCFIPH